MIARIFQGCCCVPLALGFITDSRIVRKYALSVLVLHIFPASCLQTPIRTHTHTHKQIPFTPTILSAKQAPASLSKVTTTSGTPPPSGAECAPYTQNTKEALELPTPTSRVKENNSLRSQIQKKDHNQQTRTTHIQIPNHTHTHTHNQKTKQTKQK